MFSKQLDLTGRVIGRLTVLRLLSRATSGKSIWLCQCSCGTTRELPHSRLLGGTTKSCGCLKREMMTARNTSHGHSKSGLYTRWAGMIARCSNPNHTGFKDYSGRGIAVCERWQKFENFLEDMGEPLPGMTLERKNNDLGYFPENCVWASRSANCRNKRNNHLVTYQGETLTIQEWSNRMGWKNHGVISWRLRHGWTVEEAMTVKKKPRRTPEQIATT